MPPYIGIKGSNKANIITRENVCNSGIRSRGGNCVVTRQVGCRRAMDLRSRIKQHFENGRAILVSFDGSRPDKVCRT